MLARAVDMQSATATRAAGERRFWLVKSEPAVFSFDDLAAAPERTTGWEGVRNYQARNTMRDDMRVGDGVLFYHSNAEPTGVAGIAEVARTGVVDTTAFDPRSDYHDPASSPDAPRWIMVDIRAVERLPRFVTLAQLRATAGLEGMALLQRGSRLSVQPVTPAEWATVTALGGRPSA